MLSSRNRARYPGCDAKASDGKAYTPGDAYERLSALREHLFHTPGRFAAEVPPGEYMVEAVKGFEYWPAKETIQIKAGADQVPGLNEALPSTQPGKTAKTE